MTTPSNAETGAAVSAADHRKQSNSAADHRKQSNSDAATTVAVSAGLVLLGLAVRLTGLPKDSFWMDEMWSAVCAAQPLFDALLTILRFDLHPPLYYLQLSAWGVFGTNDTWLVANSVTWSILSVVALYLTARRVYSERVARTAALFLSVLPISVYYSLELRMYALISFLAVWAWYFNYRCAASANDRRALIATAVAELTLVYSHSLGPFMLSFFLLYSLTLQLERRSVGRSLARWIAVQLVVCVATLPVALNSIYRSSSNYPTPGFERIGELIASLFGVEPLAGLLGSWVGHAIVVGVLLGMWRTPSARAIGLTLVAAPLATAIGLSYAVKPIWIGRVFIFTAPFICLLCSLLLWNLITSRRLAWGLAGAAVAVLIWSSSVAIAHPMYPENYRAVAEKLAGRLQPGDRVYMPEFPEFWGIAWYLVGPDWSSMEIQGSIPTPRWQSILRHIDARWKARLKLEPRTQHLAYGDARLVIGRTPLVDFVGDGRLWVIDLTGDERHPELGAELAALELREAELSLEHGLRIRLFTTHVQPAS